MCRRRGSGALFYPVRPRDDEIFYAHQIICDDLSTKAVDNFVENRSSLIIELKNQRFRGNDYFLGSPLTC